MFKVQMLQILETPGAYRYAEVLPNGDYARFPNTPGAVIGSLYIRKSAFKGVKPPAKITVEITADESP